jgi:hypothetical protein
MLDRYLPVLLCMLALAACGRSADPALQIYANSKGTVIVTGMLGDERSRQDLTLAIGQALAGNGKGGEVHITVDNTVRLVEWPRKLQDAMPALTGIAELGLTVQDKTVTLAGALTAEERRAMPAALQAVFGPGYVITLEPGKTVAEPAVARVAVAEPADKTIDPALLVHAWTVDVASPATRKARTASDPRANFTLSYTLGDKPQPLDNDQVGKYEFDGGVVCTLSAAEDRERRFEDRVLNETVRYFDCLGASIDGGPSPEGKEPNAVGCSHAAGRPVFSNERHTRRFVVLRDKAQVATLLIECRPQSAAAEAPGKSGAPTQSEGRIALPEGAVPK